MENEITFRVNENAPKQTVEVTGEIVERNIESPHTGREPVAKVVEPDTGATYYIPEPIEENEHVVDV